MNIIIRVTERERYVSAYDGVARTRVLEPTLLEPDERVSVSISTRNGVGDITVYAGFSEGTLKAVYRNSSLVEDCMVTLPQVRDGSDPKADLPDCSVMAVGTAEEAAGREEPRVQDAA